MESTNVWQRLIEENRILKLQIDRLREKELLAPQMKELEKDFLLFACQSPQGRELIKSLLRNPNARYSSLLRSTMMEALLTWEKVTQ